MTLGTGRKIIRNELLVYDINIFDNAKFTIKDEAENTR